MSHRPNDLASLEMGRRIAGRLRASPELLEVGRSNLARWSRQNSDSPALLRCYAEWESILDQPDEAICELLSSETEEGQRLRQNSPFAGILSPAEVWQIKKKFDNVKRHQLEHIIRAASAITGAQELIIVGSQAILGQFPNAPSELLGSMEADLFTLRDSADSDLIDGSIGEGSPFHQTFGYYGHGVAMNRLAAPKSKRPARFRAGLFRFSNS